MPKGYGNWLRIELWERFCIYMFKCTDANKNNGCGIGTEIRVSSYMQEFQCGTDQGKGGGRGVKSGLLLV